MSETKDDEQVESALVSSPKASEMGGFRTRADLVAELVSTAVAYAQDATTLSARQQFGRLLRIDRLTRDLALRVAKDEGYDTSSARSRIRDHLLANKGRVVTGEELSLVSGIAAYARRIRELRSIDGLNILNGPDHDPRTGAPLRSDEYLFVE